MEQAQSALLSPGFHQTAKYLLVFFIGILLSGTLQLGISTVSSWWLLSEVDISYVYGSSAALNETGMASPIGCTVFGKLECDCDSRSDISIF
jgi:hypothetical protein